MTNRYRGDAYRGDRELERGAHRDESRRRGPEVEPGSWDRRRGEGWYRGRVSGGYGSQYDAWSSGAGVAPAPAGFGFGPEEAPLDFRGRGPRGYRRADDRIREEVCERLTDDRAVDATDIAIDVRDGEVELSGTVPSREQKRRAENCIERVAGVHDVFNRLRIASTDRHSPPELNRR